MNDHQAAEGHRHVSHHDAFASEQMVDFLEVEGEATSEITEEAISFCSDLVDEDTNPIRQIIDFGCGPGVGTAALARAFPSATVVAVDGSDAMLERTEARAARLGFDSRVQLRQLDLDDALSSLDPCDLAWAAMAIHHAADEVTALRKIRSLVKPRGLVCLLEREKPTEVRLKQDLDQPGIWARIETARLGRSETVRASLPGADNAEKYASMLSAADLEVVVERTLSGAVEAQNDDATRQFVSRQLQQTVRDLADLADGSDLKALRAAANEPPGDATITSSRKLLISRPAPRR